MWHRGLISLLSFAILLMGPIAQADDTKLSTEERDFVHKLESWFVPGALTRAPPGCRLHAIRRHQNAMCFVDDEVGTRWLSPRAVVSTNRHRWPRQIRYLAA